MQAIQAKQWLRWCVLGLFITGCGLALGYALVGHTVIDSLYQGTTGTWLDGIIRGQHHRPIEHYYTLADRRILKGSVALGLLAWGLLGFSFSASSWAWVLFVATDLMFIILECQYGATAGLHNPDLMIGMDGGYAEIFQYVKEFGILLFLFLCFLKNRTLILLGWQTLFLYLLMDDSLRVHERLGKSLAEFLHLSPLAGLRARDIGELLISAFFGSLIMGLLSMGYYYACCRLRRISQHLLGFLSILVLFGVIFDAVHQMIDPSSRRITTLFEIIEDGGEMVTMSVIAWYIHRLMTDWSRQFPAEWQEAPQRPARSPTVPLSVAN